MKKIFFSFILILLFNCREEKQVPAIEVDSSQPNLNNHFDNLPFNPEEQVNQILKEYEASGFYEYIDIVGNIIYIKSRTTPLVTIFDINKVEIKVIEDNSPTAVSNYKVVFRCSQLFHSCIAVYRIDGKERRTANLDETIIYVDNEDAANRILNSFNILRLNLNAVNDYKKFFGIEK